MKSRISANPKHLFCVLFLLSLSFASARAQDFYPVSLSTSYNAITVSATVRAGISNDPDYDCAPNDPPPYPYNLRSVSWQVTSSAGLPAGPQGGATFYPTRYAPTCDWYYTGQDNQYQVNLSYNDTLPGPRTLTLTATFDDPAGGEIEATYQLTYSSPGAIAQPKYYIVSIVYDPPGNQSTNGFTNSNSNGTTTTTANTFTQGTGMSFGFSVVGLGNEWSYSSSQGTQTQGTAQETHTSGHGSSIRSLFDHVDHTLDHVYLWLNPQVTFVQTDSNTGIFGMMTSPGQPQDVLDLSIAEMQNPSQIPAEKCNPHVVDGVTVPGVCSVCANPSSCIAGDFAPIIAADEFVPGNVTLNPNGCTADARYCYVSSSFMQAPNPNPVFNSFTESDSNLQAQTFTQTHSYSVGYSTSSGLSLFGLFNLQQRDTTTFTWTDSQSVGSSSGVTNQAQITLGTSSPGCVTGVDIYEDTVYHSFVAVPSAPLPSGCH